MGLLLSGHISFYTRSSLIQTFGSWIYYAVEFGDQSRIFCIESFRNSRFPFFYMWGRNSGYWEGICTIMLMALFCNRVESPEELRRFFFLLVVHILISYLDAGVVIGLLKFFFFFTPLRAAINGKNGYM